MEPSNAKIDQAVNSLPAPHQREPPKPANFPTVLITPVCGQLVDSSLFLVLVRELVLVLLVALPLVAVSFLLAEGSLEVNGSTFGIFGHTVLQMYFNSVQFSGSHLQVYHFTAQSDLVKIMLGH